MNQVNKSLKQFPKVKRSALQFQVNPPKPKEKPEKEFKKLKPDVVEDERPRKKDLPAVRSRRDLVVEHEEKETLTAYDPQDMGKLKSLFGKRTEEMLNLIENNNRDGATVMIYKQLLSTLVTLLPVAEHVVRHTKGQRGVYQINQLMSQVRELMADMQAVQDRGLLGKTLVQRYVRPAFLDIAQQMVYNDQRIIAEVVPYVDAKYKDRVRDNILNAQKELGKYIQNQYEDIAENIIKGLT